MTQLGRGEQHLRAGRPREAVPYLRKAFRITGHASWAYLVALAHTGEYSELLGLQAHFEQLEGVAETPRGEGAFRQIALARMSLAVDRDAAIAVMHDIEASPRWLDVLQVMQAFHDAVQARTPFSYIRLGDGEARFLSYMDPDVETLLTWPERSSMVNSVWINWFDQPIEDFSPLLDSLRTQFLDAIDSADILGVLGTDSLIHDNYHFGFLAELQRQLLLRPAMTEKLMAAALGHQEINQRDPWFASLLQDQPFLGFVGCHPDLAARLARRFGIAAWASYVVPGENGRPLPPELKGRGHFPEVFERLMQKFVVPFPGALFLVGAGLLGKIYCARIKQLGGIALDIGSLADAWSGFNTRPGSFDAIDRFRLPK
jgi:hypothetical protein